MTEREMVARELVEAAKDVTVADEMIARAPRIEPPFRDFDVGSQFKWKRKVWKKVSDSHAKQVVDTRSVRFDEWESVQPW